MYFLGITMFQTAMLYFVTSLLKLEEGMSTLYFVAMTALSVLFYPLVSKLTPKYGKKKLILIAFGIFIVAFGYTALLGTLPIDPCPGPRPRRTGTPRAWTARTVWCPPAARPPI